MLTEIANAIARLMSLPADSLFCCLSGAILLTLYFTCGTKHTSGQDRSSVSGFALTSFVVSQLVLLSYRALLTNAFNALMPLTSGLCLFLSLHLRQQTRDNWTVLLRTIMILAVGLAVVNLAFLHVEAAALSIFGGASLAQLRSEMTVVGFAPKNDNLMVTLLLLPLCTFAWANENELRTKFQWLAALSTALNVCVLVMSFSRGIYVALLIFCGGIALLVVRRYLVFSGVPALSAVLLLLMFATIVAVLGPSHVFASLSSRGRTSEERSTVGRFTIWHKRIPLLLEHPIVGQGIGSDGMMSLRTVSSGPGAPFTAANYNLLLEITQTSGIVGLLCLGGFLFFLIAPIKDLYRHHLSSWKRQGIIIMWLGLLAACVREMTYSSLITNPPSTFLFLGLCGAISALTNDYRVGLKEKIRSLPALFKIRNLAIAAALISEVIGVVGIGIQFTKEEYISGCAELSSGDYSSALVHFREAQSHYWKNPIFDFAVALTLARSSIQNIESMQLSTALPELAESDQIRLRTARQAIVRALEYSAYDSCFWVDLGWIDSLLHEDGDAETAFRRATEVDPFDAPSLVSLGLFYERRGRMSEAEGLYARAISVSPRILRSRFWQQFKMRHINAGPQVVENSLRFLSAEPDSPIREAFKGSIHAQIGQLGSARDEYVRATSALPDLSYAWSNLAYLERDNSSDKVRETYLNRAILIDPLNADAEAQLAQLKIDAGDIATAEVIYGEALKQPIFSPHAQRATRIYGLPAPDADDVLPTGLLASITPELVFVPICGGQLNDFISHIPTSTSLLENRLSRQGRICAEQNTIKHDADIN